MKFLILVQGKSENLNGFTQFCSSQVNFIYLSYDKEITNCLIPYVNTIYLAKSTWAEGRNELYNFAKKIEEKFNYYIFMDDDAKFEDDSFYKFLTEIENDTPRIAIPLVDTIKITNKYNKLKAKHKPLCLDQTVHAYSRNDFFNCNSLPCVIDFDYLSWWYACEINQYIILNNSNSLQYNKVNVLNSNHEWGNSEDKNSLYYKGGKEKIAFLWQEITLRINIKSKVICTIQYLISDTLIFLGIVFHLEILIKWNALIQRKFYIE